MKFIEEFKVAKKKGNIKDFAKKYQLLWIVLGLIMAIFAAVSPLDYTEDVKKNKENIVALKKTIDERKETLKAGEEDTLSKEIKEITSENTKLDEEIEKLKAEKEALNK